LLAVGFYHFVKHLEYETANPGQDFDAHEAEDFRVDEDSARAGDIRRASRTWRSNQESFTPRNGSQATAGGASQAPIMRQRTLDGEYTTDQESPSKDAFDISPNLESGPSPLSMPAAVAPK
jgi:aquaporin related protein